MSQVPKVQAHYLPTDLKDKAGNSWGLGSRSHFSFHPIPHGCVVFVHGFGAGATKAWVEFPKVLPLRAEASDYDLLFYGYDGVFDTAAYSSSDFLEFLTAIATDPSGLVVNPSLPAVATRRSGGLRYNKILICAHSLGSVIVRKALIESRRLEPGSTWQDVVTLLLFAPAHKGASIIQLASQALMSLTIPFIGGAIEAVLKGKMRVLMDLEEGCKTLADLEAATLASLGPGYSANSHLRAYVVHGKKDLIVRQESFGGDYKTAWVKTKGHAAVCKPTGTYSAPTDYVVGRLSDAKWP